ncbi:glycosyl transferase [Rhodobacteraceae bacterium CCMM004]|nr:glycosyl transferase [Rhodobacteraceae bacterium CCMM004]
MARIAYILLCHKDPDAVVAQARRLTAAGDVMAIHFDARAGEPAFRRIREALGDNPNVVFARRRVRCGWGEWSLVAATLEALRAAVAAFPKATHFYMLSGDCMAIKSAEYAHALLDADDADWIESHDYFASDWIKTGFREERLIYRHLVNERKHKWWFYTLLDWQKRLGLSRPIPNGIQMMIGSQWWCLRRRTVEACLDFVDRRLDVVRFFRTTWIPDETFFQTVVRHLVPGHEIRNRTLTFLVFSDYGMPVAFYNDHYDLLLSQDALFARKISPEATRLKKRLGDLYAARGVTFRITDEGRRLHAFLTGQGRVGRRFAPRFWETESTLGRERELMIVVCKKWHVGKRLIHAIRQATNLPAVDYLFDEADTPLPDLGGLTGTIEKRTRHRRALVRLLFDYHESDRLIFCLDPRNLALMRDFDGDRSTTRFLEVDCVLSDAYLQGHAQRVGLIGANTPKAAVANLLPTIRAEIDWQTDALRDAGFDALYRISETADPAENAAALQEFLTVPPDRAREIAATPQLFAD